MWSHSQVQIFFIYVCFAGGKFTKITFYDVATHLFKMQT